MTHKFDGLDAIVTDAFCYLGQEPVIGNFLKRTRASPI